jgi:hypothetical protein
MPHFTEKKSIYYNDVNLLARPTAIDPKNALGALSRKNIPVELNRIYVSPMQAIVGKELAQKATDLGLGVCLHRFPNNSERNWGSPEGQIEIFKSLRDTSNVFVSVGLNDFDRIGMLAQAGVTNWLIDMANGYMHKSIAESVQRIRQIATIENIMVGNVHTNLGVFNIARELNYLKCPIYVRVGIAGGSPCATNDSTGYNRGQITEIIECSEFRDYCVDASCPFKFSDPILQEICDADVRIVADGGIKNSGYASKAFAAGADAIIMGGYFARAEEAETNLHGDGTYWGGASEKQQILATGTASRHSEGKEFKIEDPILPLDKLVSDLWGGISSAVSYSGYSSLKDFIYNGYFEIKENSLPPRRK